ncbi:MAG: GGDEF domain-containing protein [Phycisphaerales bacterium]|nr:GGDEF domain-containing protein [Phycisphaerales bacterium]
MAQAAGESKAPAGVAGAEDTDVLGVGVSSSCYGSIERGTPLAVRCAMLAFDIPAITGAVALIGTQMGMSVRGALVLAMGAGFGVGLMIAWSMIIAPSRKLARDRKRLIDRIARVSEVERDAQLDGLLAIDEKHELAPLAKAVHGALTRAHQHRLAASRLKREMDARVRDTARKQTAQLSRLSVTDELTGLLNRRGFTVRSAEMFGASVVGKAELSVIALDLDKFKQLNDTAGHAAGDKALQVLGELIRAHIRDGDIAGRLGGDEFVVLMPEAGSTAAAHAAERLQRMYAAHPAGRDLPWPGISAGVASRVEHGAKTMDELRHLADEALYLAKRSGRGRVTKAQGGGGDAGRTAA